MNLQIRKLVSRSLIFSYLMVLASLCAFSESALAESKWRQVLHLGRRDSTVTIYQEGAETWEGQMLGGGTAAPGYGLLRIPSFLGAASSFAWSFKFQFFGETINEQGLIQPEQEQFSPYGRRNPLGNSVSMYHAEVFMRLYYVTQRDTEEGTFVPFIGFGYNRTTFGGFSYQTHGTDINEGCSQGVAQNDSELIIAQCNKIDLKGAATYPVRRIGFSGMTNPKYALGLFEIAYEFPVVFNLDSKIIRRESKLIIGIDIGF
ncbi:MAG: hypothetical protein A2527_06775 [Candidatus Lambdaproteobacteria bacterium RIFOXYD2_FULL_50_16]|uniref:Outer membrane protein beta-barrel domain-containing protein n=1 Tax=Candidatus Lambdaproteobacteria bacterium RIFOXYD2_FULL_50_16 TaxID=1817772 RepID=A0A1F6GBP3_9PROT|nr:MAG: hypothetical protein A2527_06775 [Candidatus Lambdaproteobacteria bacterium RIFOXYD2_FULL_50_16]